MTSESFRCRLLHCPISPYWNRRCRRLILEQPLYSILLSEDTSLLLPHATLIQKLLEHGSIQNPSAARWSRSTTSDMRRQGPSPLRKSRSDLKPTMTSSHPVSPQAHRRVALSTSTRLPYAKSFFNCKLKPTLIDTKASIKPKPRPRVRGSMTPIERC